MNRSTGPSSDKIDQLRQALAASDAMVIGAGAGLSTSAGYVYSGERFQRYFSDFAAKYSFRDMYSGGFYPFSTPEELWAYWSRYIFINRYTDPPRPVYRELLALVQDRDYFVLTTNVDHCFQKAGFDKKRLFYTQGDYGLWQCSEPCHRKTYDNESAVRQMVMAQGFTVGDNGALTVPEGAQLRMTVPTELVPRCPVCSKPMRMNLRSDDTFAEDEGWHAAAERYADFLRTRGGRVLYLELGVGYNTPGIIKYPFWQMTARNPEATYACLNYGDAACPSAIADRSICIDGDIGQIIRDLQ
ncbi:MAG: Sir2 silent information regulator family NAD-dependent deacetylase [Ruminococcaceae bacterium]|nr:Sir2 silent information regulator family NAD-dependent deacetylase [Oscillospiraceae bacterium]